MKKKIAITLDPRTIAIIDRQRASLCMKRSTYINYYLRKMKK